jgi:mannose-6-phosphate isomerase-like protein (cupin superfamily)
MKGFHVNIEKDTTENRDFRRVLYTGRQSQLVLMNLKPNEEIGKETHPENDQFFRFESGQGRVTVEDQVYAVKDGDAVLVPAGAEHNVQNISATEDLKLYTLYSPPHHRDGIVRSGKAEAESDEAEFDGRTTE